jgi:anti-anti-sigma factor
MTIVRETRRGATVVTLPARVDAVNAHELEAVLVSAVAVRRAVCVVDLGGVRAMTVAGLRPFLVAIRRANEAGSRIVLAGMPDAARGLFDSSGFGTLFETRDNVDSALDRMP